MKNTFIAASSISIMVLAIIYAGSFLNYCHGVDWKHPYCPSINEFGIFYGKNLRGSLFSGFLTLGGFLLSLKTFIVVNMKKEVFDTPEYKKEWEDQKKLDSSNKMGLRFDPLRHLSTILFISITACITTAVLQLTLGLLENFLSSLICIWSGCVSIMFLLKSLFLIRQNLNRMFDFLNK